MRSVDWASLVGTLFFLSLELPHKIRLKSYKLTLGFLISISTCLLSNITRCHPVLFLYPSVRVIRCLGLDSSHLSILLPPIGLQLSPSSYILSSYCGSPS